MTRPSKSKFKFRNNLRVCARFKKLMCHGNVSNAFTFRCNLPTACGRCVGTFVPVTKNRSTPSASHAGVGNGMLKD